MAEAIIPFPVARRDVPRNRQKTIIKAVKAGAVADLNPVLRERQTQAYRQSLAGLGAYDFAARMLENVAYCLTEEGRAKFKELTRLSVTPHHPPEYRLAVAKLEGWL